MAAAANTPMKPDAGKCHTTSLERRALTLRTQAEDMNPMEALAFRRRAAELELEVWAIKVRSGDDIALAA